MSADAASKLFIYIGISTFIGRLLSGFLCKMRFVNPIFVLMFSLILDGSSNIFLSQSKTYEQLTAFSFFYGLADGLEIGTFNITMLNCVEPSKRASAFGLSALFYGTTIATGPPLAGTFIFFINLFSHHGCTELHLVTILHSPDYTKSTSLG